MGLPQNARIHYGFSSAARKIGSLDGKLGSERNAFHHLAGDMAIRHGYGYYLTPSTNLKGGAGQAVA